MLDCLDVAKYFIIRSHESGREDTITNMKVQKLLYYAQSLHLALFDEPLFEQEIQAWRYGPVCPVAYSFYSGFEANQLPIPSPEILESIPNSQKEVLDEVWQYFGEYHAYSLSGLTHLEFPWKKARKGLHPNAPSQEQISQQDMRLLGLKKLEEIEEAHPSYPQIIAHLLKQTFSTNTEPKYVKQGEASDWLNSLLT